MWPCPAPTRRRRLICLWAAITLGLWSGNATGGPAADTDTRPNILFILTDDQAPTAVGHAGNPDLKTPNLDRIFREGATLENSFVTTPVCSPSRAGLMTSRYGSELGILDWINPGREPDLGLDPTLKTWPEVLQQAGYSTGLVGKWHLGTADRFHPTQFGYQTFFGFRAGGTTPKDPLLERNGQQQRFPGITADVLTDGALEFLEQHRERPFVLSLHYRAPHAAWLPVRDEDWAPYRDLDPQIPNPDWPHLDTLRIKRMTREYYASVASVDRNVGRLLEALQHHGLAERTIVIFTSDHGYNLGHNGVWYKGNAQWQLTRLPPQQWPKIPPKQRPNLFDQSLRVPTAIRWPGVIPPGTRIRQTFSNLDWYPTLLAMAAVDVPAGTRLHGRNFVPVLKNPEQAWDNDLYAEYSMRHGAQTDMRAWRTPRWKLMIDFANPGRVELYDLQGDPAETRNLAFDDEPALRDIQQQLRDKIVAQMRRLADPAVPTVPVDQR